MIEAVRKESDAYLSAFADLQRDGSPPDWLGRCRKSAMERFQTLGFPTPRIEDWKYTRVAPIAETPFRLAPGGQNPDASRLEGITFANLQCPRAVFVDGHFSARLSSLEGLPGTVAVRSLAEVLDSEPELLEPHLARHADWKQHSFVALNTAFIQDGAFIHVPRGQVIEQPLHLLYLSTAPAREQMTHPRNLILAEEDSQVAVLESYVGLHERPYFTNLVTEIVAAENAVVDHYKLLQESRKAYHISMLQTYQRRSSSVRTFNITLGGLLTRNEVNTLMDGEGAECALDGLYLLSGSQHVDNHTRLEHAQPHCDSREVYKGILDGQATGVFHGRIVVQPGAQKTDSKQTNNNLLLSDQALVNTKPQLEIYADDVKCTHGATIGQLDENALFYLRCRGIDASTARSILIYAFASEVIQRVKVPSVRRELDNYLFEWLPRGHLVKEAV